MEFDREKAYGMRLNIAAGTAVRFEPGEEKDIELVEFGGNKKIVGFNGLVNGDINELNKQQALDQATSGHFKNKRHELIYQQDQICQYVWSHGG